jgi:hypothetical protein
MLSKYKELTGHTTAKILGNKGISHPHRLLKKQNVNFTSHSTSTCMHQQLKTADYMFW